MTTHFTISKIDHISEKATKFSYSSCAIHGKYCIFGTSSGSLHIFLLNNPSYFKIVPFTRLVGNIHLVSISPGGKWLALANNNGVHIIDDPLLPSVNESNLFFSVPCNGNKVTAVHWLLEPPGKLDRKIPYLIVGDSKGCIWQVSHQNPILLLDPSINNPFPHRANANAPPPPNPDNSIIQISSFEDNILIASTAGQYVLENGQPKTFKPGKRQPPGPFGAYYVDYMHNSDAIQVICLSRPDGKLALADKTKKIKATISFLPTELDQNFFYHMGKLMFCPPYLLSLSANNVAYLINMTSMTLVKIYNDFVDFIDASSHKSNVLMLCKSGVLVLHVCQTVLEYIKYLISKNELAEAQRLVLQEQISDENILNSLKSHENPEFQEYLDKISLQNQPRLLKDVDLELYNKLMSEDIPGHLTIEAIVEIRSFILFDEETSEKIEKYVIAYPKMWDQWTDVINPDRIVPILNENPKNAGFISEIARLGKSLLCKILATIDNQKMDFLVQNSPPIHSYNLTGARKEEFEKRLSEVDHFVDEFVGERHPLVESIYNHELAKYNEENLTPIDTIRLMKLYNWEIEVCNSVSELKSKTEVYLLTREAQEIPQWVTASLKNEKSGHQVNDFQQDGAGNWGTVVTLTTCPICGMDHNLGEAACSIAAFPCSHVYHVSCLHSRYCPVCFSQCMEKIKSE